MDVFLFSGRHLTVFNSQSLLQVGGKWSEYKQTLDMPFQVDHTVINIIYENITITGSADWDIIQWNETPRHGSSKKSPHQGPRCAHTSHLYSLWLQGEKFKQFEFKYKNFSMLKARNPELFVDSGLESTSRLFSHDGSGNRHSTLLSK